MKVLFSMLIFILKGVGELVFGALVLVVSGNWVLLLFLFVHSKCFVLFVCTSSLFQALQVCSVNVEYVYTLCKLILCCSTLSSVKAKLKTFLFSQ